ncbi:NTF2-like protein [Aspergillus avenaceus]|uniref:NTF2-like protein n=1 Tax=Aspergillus avenaceus TaxID=36643 RepID=A0A5N6U995_ASPAV|nr:NTF2-like protein [Aspergillus avenaceus]
MSFNIYIPHNLTFPDYISIIQTARAFADGYDLKDSSRLRATLADTVTADYSNISRALGCKTYSKEDFIATFLSPHALGKKDLLTQHLLGQPYFVDVTADEIVVEWQQVAGHGKAIRDGEELSKRTSVTSDGRSYMRQVFGRVDGGWRIKALKPSLLFETGDFKEVTKSSL